MSLAYRRCCGIDVHKKSVTLTVLPPVGRTDLPRKTLTFRTFKRDLVQMRGYLLRAKVTDVVMESTGQYWRAVWNVLEGHFAQLVLINPQHAKAIAGKKTDPLDSERLAELLQDGRLHGSFVPDRPIRELRDLTRSRVHLLEELNRVKNRIEQLCQAANIKISSVASDLFGVSGRKMLRALAEGKHDAGWMADYARGSLRGKKRELEWALEGTLTEHQRWLLSRLLEQLAWLEQRVEEMEQEIRHRMEPYQEVARRLDTIPGVDEITTWALVAEFGPDMSAFVDGRHAASWAGVCPGNRESGGKQLSGKTRKANRYVRRALSQAAWAAAHDSKTALSGLFRRLRARKGEQKAIWAVAHQIVRIAYEMVKKGEDYREVGADYYDRQQKPKVTQKLVERLQRLGYYVTLREIPQELLGGESESAKPLQMLPDASGGFS